MLHTHKTFSVGRTEVITTGFGKSHALKQAQLQESSGTAGSASWNEESSTTCKTLKMLQALHCTESSPKGDTPESNVCRWLTCHAWGAALPCTNKARLKPRQCPQTVNSRTGFPAHCSAIQHKINLVFSKHFNLLEFFCRKARLQLLLAPIWSLSTRRCWSSRTVDLCKLYPIFCLGLS